MQEWLSSSYLVIKSFHLIFVISWMAGLFYLPRLFVYHASSDITPETAATFKIMERRLLKIIMTPAMILSWVFGLLLAFTPGILAAPNGWFHVKLFAALVMSSLHGYLSKCVKVFARDQNAHSPRFYRILNEVPTLLMILIIFLVVLKPF